VKSYIISQIVKPERVASLIISYRVVKLIQDIRATVEVIIICSLLVKPDKEGRSKDEESYGC